MDTYVLAINWDEWRNDWTIRKLKCHVKSKKKNVIEVILQGSSRGIYIPNSQFKGGAVLFSASDEVYNAETWATNNRNHCIFILEESSNSYKRGMIKFFRVIISENERSILLGRKVEQDVRNSIFSHGLFSHSDM